MLPTKTILPFILSLLLMLLTASTLVSTQLFAQSPLTLKKANQWQGVAFPEFELMDQDKTVRKNSDFLGQWIVYFFYPKDRTPGCTEEAKNFVADHQKFTALETSIVGISYDDSESHKDFANTYDMKFTLLADVKKKLTKSLKVDRFLPWPHPSRQSFLVNPKGIIVKHYEAVDPKEHSAELLVDIVKLKQTK